MSRAFESARVHIKVFIFLRIPSTFLDYLSWNFLVWWWLTKPLLGSKPRFASGKMVITRLVHDQPSTAKSLRYGRPRKDSVLRDRIEEIISYIKNCWFWGYRWFGNFSRRDTPIRIPIPESFSGILRFKPNLPPTIPSRQFCCCSCFFL